MTQTNRSWPFVSVIVPVYNGERTIQKCVQSLLAQTYPKDRFEIIIADNNSKDKTSQLLKPYSDKNEIVLVHENKVLNAYGARNTAAKIAKGEILAFTDADCVAKATWLEKLLNSEADEKIGIFIGDILAYEPKTAIERFYSSEKLSLRTKDLSGFIGMRAGNCAIRKSVFWKLEGFNFQIPSGGDSDFLGRMMNDGSYVYKVELDSVVFHKNYDRLRDIFKRGMRFGTNLERVRHDCRLKSSYMGLGQNIKKIIISLGSLVLRLLVVPFLKNGGVYNRKKIQDREMFVVEPLISLAEETGLLIGRIIRIAPHC